MTLMKTEEADGPARPMTFSGLGDGVVFVNNKNHNWPGAISHGMSLADLKFPCVTVSSV
jgi:hypothetical protein